ncbi:MAG: cobalamin B12-binding domain-containing protein [Dehalococcoidales bacterium]
MSDKGGQTTGRLRVLLGKPGLDGHDRGIKIIARGFRDAGFEVIYTGLHQTPEEIAAAAVQEDVDLIGLSCLSGAHRHLFGEVIRELAARGAGDVPVIVGGIIPEEDVPLLEQAGVSRVFSPGAPLRDIVDWVRENVATTT